MNRKTLQLALVAVIAVGVGEMGWAWSHPAPRVTAADRLQIACDQLNELTNRPDPFDEPPARFADLHITVCGY